MENPAILAVAIVFFLALFGAGVLVAYFVGRRGHQPHDPRKLPERYVRELQQCLELGGHATRDADALRAVLAGQRPAVTPQVASAVEQLIHTTADLSERVNQISAEAHIPLPETDFLPAYDYPTTADETQPVTATSAATFVSPDLQLTPTTLTQEEVDWNKDGKLPPSPFDDARQFKRSSFRGAAKATIYPAKPGPGRDSVQCTVLTRNLSCGGIGIAHSEQLFPKQVVVLDAVGKLLVGEVRWCRREDEDFYVAGCRLVKTNG